MKERHVRNLTKTLAVLSLLNPVGAYSLGIGSIKLHSALNQNLNAEIPLLLSPGEKVSDIKVNLASPDKFDEAGIPWNYFLSKIKFETVLRSDGLVVIKVTSQEALKEPFLGVLLEVSWPKGSLYREFSLLVDPPEVYEQATVPVITLPEKSTFPSTFTPSEIVTERQRGFGSSGTFTQPQQTKPASNKKLSDTYGPTRKSDTLWNISEHASKKRNVSLPQMMISIFRGNPDAFFTENINALRTGKVLKIPKREAVIKLSRREALAEYERQTSAWKNRSTAGTVEKAPAAEKAPQEKQTVENQLTLAAPSVESVSEDAVITPGKEQAKTSGGANNKELASTGSAKTGTAEKAPGYDLLENKVIELQRQLTKMQEILAVKDQQLAAMQNQINAQPPTIAQPSSAPSVRAEESSLPAPVSRTTPQPIKPKAVESAVKRGVGNYANKQESDSYFLTLVSGVVLFILSGLGWFWWRKRKISSMMDDTGSHFAPTENYPSQEQPLAHIARVNAPLLDDTNLFQIGPTGDESSFLSEFTPGDFETFDNDEAEIDPISEADVYLAYGRYQQAEDLIRQAITDHPGRDDCKLKLLEIFYAVENKKAYEAYAEELAASGMDSNKIFWNKVVEMGNELNPNSPLFSSMDSEDAATKAVDTANDETDLENFTSSESADYDLSSFDDLLKDSTASENTIAEPTFELDEEPQNNLDFDIDYNSLTKDAEDLNPTDTALSDITPEPKESDSQFDLETFDFDLSDENTQKSQFEDIDLSGSKIEEQFALGDNLGLDNDFNFDFDLSDTEEQESSENDIVGVSDLTDMDEFETKLDLARAYLDMGDQDSAKDITEEVLERGSEEQKKAAQQLINSLR